MAERSRKKRPRGRPRSGADLWSPLMVEFIALRRQGLNENLAAFSVVEAHRGDWPAKTSGRRKVSTDASRARDLKRRIRARGPELSIPWIKAQKLGKPLERALIMLARDLQRIRDSELEPHLKEMFEAEIRRSLHSL